MSLTDAQVKELADALWDAEQTHNYVSPLTERYADISAEDAYRVQQVVLDRKLAGGEEDCRQEGRIDQRRNAADARH